ncbi:MAG TPA: hypothetical protein PK537_03480 [Candidatus Limiplasma sp.]|nr:hypothetical protein [Candidatus Limiplasma sp.]
MQTKQRGVHRMGVQSPLVLYLNTLLSVLILSLLFFISLAPLLALFVFEKGSPWQYLALLSPLLMIFILLPLRFSFAQAVTARYHHMPFTLKTAFSFSLYGEKVSEGLLYAVHIIKWMIPLIVACATMYYTFIHTIAFTDLISDIADFGTSATAVWNGFLQFFGGAKDALPGGFAEGIYAILIGLGLCVLLIIWGIVRTSAYRYIWAEATELDKNPHAEARRSLRGRRLKQLGIALINLALLAPALIVLYQLIQPKQATEDIAMQIATALTAGTVPEILIPYGKLAFVFFVCYLPFVPLRRILTGHFATARMRRQLYAAEAAQAGSIEQEPMPVLYEDKPAASLKKKS